MAAKKEKFKTYGNVFDQFTMRNLFKLKSQGYFDDVKSPISIGKEANIFSAVKKDGSQVILKIYRLENCDFNRMYDYIKFDPRYLQVKKQKRKIIFAWAQREFRNLLKARENGVKVPTPHTFKDNILVLEFIGKKEVAPKLKDSIPRNKQKFLDKVIENMKKLHRADLVHGDLSSFNILNLDENPVLIDFSQASPLSSMNAEELFERDVKNIAHFFGKYIKVNKDNIKKKILE